MTDFLDEFNKRSTVTPSSRKANETKVGNTGIRILKNNGGFQFFGHGTEFLYVERADVEEFFKALDELRS
jgi:hypothetical protein